MRPSNSVRPFNEHEVSTILEKHDFVTVTIEDHSFLEQVRVFAGAKIIVRTAGAQWTGAIFSSGTKCLIMEPDFLSGSSLFSNLVHIGNGVLFEMLMGVAVSKWKEYHHSKSLGYLNTRQLERVLKELESH